TMVLTLDRPQKGNALRRHDTEALADMVERVDGGGDERCILIRARGKDFCTGADLHAANATDTQPRVGHMVRTLEAGPHRLIEALWNTRVPTVSAVQGRAMGLGLHLAVVCDFVLCTPDAVFAEPFCRRGFSVDSGGSFLLPRLVGIRRARQMLLRGTSVDAATAAAWGLVDGVVENAALHEAAAALAAELAAGPTFSLGHTKELLNRRGSTDLGAALRAEADGVEATIRSADFKEGIRAFVERRDPIFTGH
ncbi:enoyl-CoA hydratase/isomerase family protein, partial [uncultured Mycobacterium sp.]|uniref:enoyl-CoA hydratase/isomerase family protein n=1 Tax=uncultured Mycobacterium sp. TaxID=171292 RepID=UPI0035CA5879